MTLTPPYHGFCDPVFPCRIMPTRHCPAVYESTCGDRLCARFEERDTPVLVAVWMAEIETGNAVNPD